MILSILNYTLEMLLLINPLAHRNIFQQLHFSLISVLLLTGCSALQASKIESDRIHTLELGAPFKKLEIQRDLVIDVSLPRARPGFETSKMAYLLKPHELSYFAINRWVDSPAKMLHPLLVQALEESKSFRAILHTPENIPANIRLETEVIRFQQNFTLKPSQIQLTLKIQLVNVTSKRVIAVNVFEDSEKTLSEDAYGGVVAANLAVQRVLEQITNFCITKTANLQ